MAWIFAGRNKLNNARVNEIDLTGQRLLTVIISFALFSFGFGNLFQSLLNTEATRFRASALSPELVAGLFLVLTSVFFVRIRRRLVLTRASVPTAAFFLFIAIAFTVSMGAHGNFRSIVTFSGMAAMYVVSRLIFRRHYEFLSLNLKHGLYWFPLIVVLFMMLFLAGGRIEYLTGAFKPQIVGGIRSTEVSLIIGMQIMYLTYCLDASGRGGERLRYELMLAVALSMLVWLMSLGTFIALAIALFVRHRFRENLCRRPVRSGALFMYGAVAIICLMLGGVFYVEVIGKIELITSGGGRAAIFKELLYFISQNPYTGIGLGQYSKLGTTGTYPHSNILGFATELGIFVSAAYVFFVVTIVWFGFAEFRRLGCSTGRCALAVLCLTVFVYLQVKGLVQDTWQLKENYFWGGALVGSIENMRRCRTGRL